MKHIRFILIFVSTLLLVCTLAGCIAVQSDGQQLVVTGDSIIVNKEPVSSIDNAALVDNRYLYTQDQNDSVVTMYLTVSRGTDSENTDYSWPEINNYSIYDYEKMNVDRFQVEGLLQVGDEKGPIAGQLGFGLKIPNATVQVRGATTSRMPQKSFKIELKKDSGEWNQQRTINLNKHVFDGLRFRNKLCYDLLKEIPDMVSLRTQFVHLYVKDNTAKEDKGFVDYGLYTQVEQPNTRFLRSHGLDSNGQLYKMVFFEYDQYKDAILLKSDPKYDVSKFESILEIKGSDDHSKLIAMLGDVNDYSKPIETVFEKYFDSDNYFTWLAFNILVGNIDTQSRNNYLYSPLNSNKWYYICWDCDAALTRYEHDLIDPDRIGYEYGVSNYWGDVLFSRVMQIPKYRALLDEKVEALHKIITRQRVDSMARTYQAVVEKYLFQMPDVMYSSYSHKDYLAMAATFSEELDLNYELYQQSLKMPMPFYLDAPDNQEEKLFFRWDPAFCFDGQDVTYTFELSKDFTMKKTIIKEDSLNFPTTAIKMLKPGKYFYRVRATNKAGYTQWAMAYYVKDDVKYYGTQCFYVLKDGSIEVEEAHE